jgi:hypothetical protein
MKTLRSTFIVLSIVALALIVAPVALADSLTPVQTTSVGLQTTDLVGVVATPPITLFDTSLGTLNSVIITFQGGENSSFVLKNVAVGSETFGYQEFLDFYLGNSNGTINSLLGSLTPSVVNVNNPSITLASGASISYGPITTPTNIDSVTLTSNLALFEGVGNLPNFLVTTDTFTAYNGGGGNLTTTDSSLASGTITVQYDYSQSGIPEPGTLSLFGTGLLGLAGMLRRKFAK